MELVTAFFVSITLGGTETARIGPYGDGGQCWDMKATMERSIQQGFDHSTPYGITGDPWGAGGGAIWRAQDYKLECFSETMNIRTGEIVASSR